MEPSRYVHHKDLQVFPPPIHCGDVRLYAFFAKADPLALQRWVDRWFNLPARGELDFQAVGGHVMLTFQEVASLQSLDPQGARIGSTSELEASVWVPIAQKPPRKPIAGLALPWIWPDSSLAVATGRELYGFRKQLSYVRMPTETTHGHHDTETAAACAAAAQSPAPFQLDTLAFRTMGPDDVARRYETLRIERVDLPDVGPVVALGDRVESLKDALDRGGHDLARFASILCHFSELRVPMLLTKQFRAVDSCDAACHLSVVECCATDLEFESIHLLLGRWRLVVQDLASQPIATDLGLELDADGAMALDPVAVKLHYSFDLDAGKRVWRAPENDEDLEIRVLREVRKRVEALRDDVLARVRARFGG